MMHTVDEIDVAAPAERVFKFAADVERWPAILPHYRWVRFHRPLRTHDPRLVEMAAYRPFRHFNWPAWWKSEMWVDTERREVRYKHVEGVTRGMDVLWRVDATGDATSHVTLVHDWTGPVWPLIRRPAAEWVIGPVFVHGIATRTLAGVARAAEGA